MEHIATIAGHSWRLLFLPLVLLCQPLSMAAAAANSGMLTVADNLTTALLMCVLLTMMPKRPLHQPQARETEPFPRGKTRGMQSGERSDAFSSAISA